MSMQVCDVTKPLGSVRAMVKAGNRIVFDEGGSYIQHTTSGVKTQIEDKNGAFAFDIWVPRGDEQGNTGYQGKYWQALAEEGRDNEQMGSVGLGDLLCTRVVP